MRNKHYVQSLHQHMVDNQLIVRVLLIEDDASYADLVKILLGANPEQECDVTVSSTLRDGLQQLGGDKDFDAVLLDLSLPDSDGLATLHAVIDAFPNTNVIVLTGTSDREQGVRAVGAGAQDYLVKGEFKPNQLARVLRFSIERKHILMRLEEAQKIAKIGTWEYRPADNYFFASKQVFEMLRVDPAEKAYTYANMLDTSCPFFLLRKQEDYPAEEALNEQLEWTFEDGRIVYVQLNSRKERKADGELIYFGTLQDTTLQRQAEELQRSKELAEETARVREQVIATVSHELRTPMNAIVGMSNLLIGTQLNEEQQQYVYSVQDASQLLLGIINDILLTSSLQNAAVELELKPFDLTLTVRRIIEALMPRAISKDISLNFSIEPQLNYRLLGDKRRLSQVLYNILGNAVKFTESGQVSLSIQWKNGGDDEGFFVFVIQDTGPGIAKEKHEEVFQAFTRIQQKGEQQEGTGLGLSIAKQLIENMGGVIELESALGHGATFTFRLPLKLEKQEDVTVVNVSTRSSAGNMSAVSPDRILIVEDHPMNQIVLQKTLTRQWPELEVLIAANAEEALRHLEHAESFDLIFMDIQLPGKDGFTLTQQLRAYMGGKYEKTPILAITAQTQIAEDERYLKAGMNDYVLKPFSPEELYQKITQHILK